MTEWGAGRRRRALSNRERRRSAAVGLNTARRLADGQTARCRVKIDGGCVVCTAKFDVEVYADGRHDSYMTAASLYLSERNFARACRR